MARDELLRTADDYGFAVVAYSFMPDHVHALVRGTGAGSNFRLFMAAFRGRSSRHCARTCSLPLWQRGYHERVLRDHDPTERVVAYIVSNPVRAGFVTDPMTYRFSWAEGWPAKVSQPS
jgi:putative transposase